MTRIWLLLLRPLLFLLDIASKLSSHAMTISSQLMCYVLFTMLSLFDVIFFYLHSRFSWFFNTNVSRIKTLILGRTSFFAIFPWHLLLLSLQWFLQYKCKIQVNFNIYIWNKNCTMITYTSKNPNFKNIQTKYTYLCLWDITAVSSSDF